MATCDNVQIIYDSECIGESLNKINSNFFNLDSGLCQLGQDLLALEAFVKSLTVKDSPTVDMSISIGGYFLSADVVNNSLGTIKLGQDIPQTTKVFLTAAKVSSLIDTNINNPVQGELLLWSGTKWVNQSIVDNVGATILNELEDVELISPLINGQILKYNQLLNRWENGPDSTELTIRNGDYGHILVQDGPAGLGPNGRGGPGTRWDIKQGVVTERELAKDSVTNIKIQDGAVTNSKILSATIQLDRCAFSVGEVNTGINIGNGQGIYTGQNDALGRLPFKSLRGDGDVTITADLSTITISVPPQPVIPPPPPQPPDEIYNVTFTDPVSTQGSNLGAGTAIYNSAVSSPNNLKFKTIKGQGVSIADNGSEITLSVAHPPLALNLLGPTGSSEIISLLNQVYPPNNFNGATCRVIVVTPQFIGSLSNYVVSIPLTISYNWNGNQNNVGNQFTLTDPPNVSVSDGTYTNSKNIEGTAIPINNVIPFTVSAPTVTIFTCNGTTWSS